MTKKTLLTVVAVSILSGGIVAAGNAYAQTTTPSQTEPMNGLVQKIADTFHLNKDDVQKVFDQNKQDMQAKREANYEAKLQNLVTSGKITAAQKDLLIAKHKELLSEMESNKSKMKDMTPAERKAQMDQNRTDIENWAKQNGIDAKYLMLMGPGRRGHGGFGMRDRNAPTPTPTP